MGWISSKYENTRCKSCRAPVPTGARVWWQPNTRGVICEPCRTGAPVPTSAPARPDERGSDPVFVQEFESGIAFREFLRGPVHPGSARDEREKRLHPDSALLAASAGHDITGEDWYGPGIKNTAEAFTALIHGWPAGETIARDALQIFPAPIVRARRRVFRWSEEGEFDRQRFLDGEEDCCRDLTYKTDAAGSRARYVRIIVQCNVSACYGIDEFIWSGAAATALADALEAQGVRVRIDAAITTIDVWKDRPGIAATLVPVKSYNEPLDISRVLAWTSMPAVFRAAGFRWFMMHGPVNGHMGGGSGSTERVTRALREKLDDPDTIFIERKLYKRDALETLKTELTRLNIDFE